MRSTVELPEACCTLPPFKGSDYVPQGTIQPFEGNPDFILELRLTVRYRHELLRCRSQGFTDLFDFFVR